MFSSMSLTRLASIDSVSAIVANRVVVTSGSGNRVGVPYIGKTLLKEQETIYRI
jgi:hypothetical protein